MLVTVAVVDSRDEADDLVSALAQRGIHACTAADGLACLGGAPNFAVVRVLVTEADHEQAIAVVHATSGSTVFSRRTRSS